jgi:putative ABC transport system permease protein
VNNVPFRVIGVLERKGQSAWGQDQDDVVLVPLSTGRRNIIGRNPATARAVGSISVKVTDPRMLPAAMTEIRAVLRQRHRLQPDQEDDFVMHDLAEMTRAQASASNVLSMLLAAIASVSLLSGGVGIMNIMLVSVRERTREIGLRIAVGARGRDILAQFLVEALALSILGGLIGVGVGVGAAYTLSYLATWRALVELHMVLAAIAIAAALGIAFGIYPAHRAARLNPIDALRYE